MKISQIKDQIKKLAKDFGLEYNSKWFNYIFVNPEEYVLSVFLTDCRDEVYEKYGCELSERVNNLNKFYNSLDFKKMNKKINGQMISKKHLLVYQKIVDRLSNQKIKNILFNFCEKIEKKLNHSERIAVLTKHEKSNEIYHILIHEWMHILFEENQIRFKNWKNNEGLITYVSYYIQNKLNKLEDQLKYTNSEFGKEYFRNAIKFRELLENALTPKERRNKIKSLMKRLK